MANNPKFTVLYEKLRGKTFEIDRESMSIGRKEGVDIRIQDGSVSSHHADIIRSEQAGKTVYILRDNDSTNGTRINNVALAGEQTLKNSDLIMFGNVEVLFDGLAGQEENSADFSQLTHTIDISNTGTRTDTTQALENFNPLAADEERKQKMMKHGMLIFYILMGVAALVVLFVVFYSISKFSK